MARVYDFAGQKITVPGAYTRRLFPEDEGAGSVTGRVVIMGEASKGGIPYNAETDIEDVINVITGQAQALDVFGGGDVYYGAEFYLTPTKDARFTKPSQANCVIVNQMTQAITTLKDSGNNSIIDVSVNIYGTDGNSTAIKVSTGTNAGKLLQMVYKGEEVLNQDDVNLSLMSIQYTGTGTTASITINTTTITTDCALATNDNLNITLADYSDMGSLINYINNQPNYTCTLTGQSDEFTNVFDAVTTQDIKSSAYECLGIVEAVIRVLNATERVTATLTTSAARNVIDNLANFQFLTGGTVSAATTDDWVAALAKLEQYDLNNIVAMTGSTVIQDLVTVHVEAMNGVKIKKYRQAGTGAGSSAVTKADRIAQMKAMNSAYMEYCVSSFERYDYVNKVTASFYPYYLYALIAGFRYANNVGMDIVFKYLNVLSTPTITKIPDQDDYALAGATFIQKTVNVNNASQFEIIANNTTYQGSQITLTNPAVLYEINVLTKDFEEQVISQIRGLPTVANSVVIGQIQNWILTYLFPHYRDDLKWITDGPDGQKAFDNVSFSQVGEQFITTATLTMSVTPRYSFNFMTYIVPGQNV
jgi:hypothetical protein